MLALSGPEARLAAAIGWSLLHSLWQGVFVGIALAIALRTMRNLPATTRYALCCGALAVLALCPLLPLIGLDLNASHPAATTLLSVPSPAAKASVLSNAADPTVHSLIRTTQRWLPAIVLMWILGAGFALARIAAGLIRARTLRRASQACVSGPSFEMLNRLAGVLGISRNVRLFVSPDTAMPVVTGWQKPAILLPPSFLRDLSSAEMETIIVHELAHIQRRDYPANVAQAALEALFFYHPAVWWIARQIRREREHCCDDIALRVTGSPLACAKALTTLEERRSSAVPALLPASSQGDLTMRIRRILAPDRNKPLRRGVTYSVVSLSLCTATLLVALSFAVANTMRPLIAEAAATPNPAELSSKQRSPQPPNMDCTYYKRPLAISASAETGKWVSHPGSCVDTGSDTGTFYCRQIDEDQQQQKQSACQWKVQRLHQWQKQLQESK